ncbi:MAG: hypothetical protein JWM35_1552 [Verrucomicrobia bacterium]|nr:hypothetical protein [Verrucomicrobiota bacterium]
MNDTPAPSKSANPVVTGLVMAAVPLAAFLAFLVQPMLGKRLLPIYGGTSGTWLGCMVYFQLALMLGYTWAAWLVRKRFSFQVAATAILSVIAILSFHLPSDQVEGAAGITRVVWNLSLASLPAMVLLFSTSPLLHGWLSRRGEEIPYYLYAISNAGSLIALLIYPFLIETNFGLEEQKYFWHGFLVIVAGLLGTAGFILKRQLRSDDAPPAAISAEAPAPGMMFLWLAISALTCVAMLGATYHLAAEMGSNPLAWVGPFGAYLLSFMITFSGRWRRWMTITTIAVLAVSLSGFMVAKGFTPATVNSLTAWWLLLLSFTGSLLGNALLYSVRPARQLEKFYLVLAGGGVIGGILSSTVIPSLLSQPVEFVLASVALLVIGMLWLLGRRDPIAVFVTAWVLFIPVLGLGIHQRGLDAMNNGKIRHLRDLYGHVMIKTDASSVVLSSDTTTHGTQLTADLPARRRPTLYYSESSGIGRVLEKLQAERPDMRVGVIGLGAGTLAAYARKEDTYDFWDIDPKAMLVAREHFTYVAESPGHINLIKRDGRKALEASKENYDVIVIDAFTGDGVPSHLLTREAMQVYFSRLGVKNGLLVVHASSRYSRLFPVVEGTARTLFHMSLDVGTDITESTPTRDWDPTHTEYIIVGIPSMMNNVVGWFSEEEEKGRVKHSISTVQSPLYNPRLIWTDDRNAEIDAFELGRFLLD